MGPFTLIKPADPSEEGRSMAIDEELSCILKVKHRLY